MKRRSPFLPQPLSRLSLVFAPAVIMVLASLALGACGAGSQVGSSDSPLTLETSTSSALESTATRAAETTTTVLPAAIPPELLQYRGLAKRLEAQGVAVAELRQMPYQEDYGPGVEVVLRSRSSGQMNAPEDTMGGAIVFREAVFEKMAGTTIAAVAVAYLKPSGQISLGFVVPVNRTIDTSWFTSPGLSLEEVAQRVKAEVLAKLASSPFKLVDVTAKKDPDGSRVLWAKFTVASVAAANQVLSDSSSNPGNMVADAVDRLNAQNQAKIGVLRTEIDTEAGEPVLYVYTDLDMNTGTSWIAPGITNLFGPSPTATTSTGGT